MINNRQYKARRIAVIGVTGTGKSTLMLRVVDTHPGDLILIFDWQAREFSEELGIRPAESRHELEEKIASGQRVITFDPTCEAGAPLEDAKPDFEWFCEMAY